MDILIYGKNGWIGGKLIEHINNNFPEIKLSVSNVRLENYGELINELDEIKPSRVILAAGLTGRPNVDWCEDNKDETLNINVIGVSVLASECNKRNIHFTYLGTGCIYEYDENHTIEDALKNSNGFTETDEPNFDKSFYSKTKIITENILKNMKNVLTLRLRMPLSDDLHLRNFITKITKYEKVVNVPNSMSILHDLVPIIVDMSITKKVGIYNFTNPGVISHNDILSLYKQYINPEFTWKNFTLEEQSKILKAGRSNNSLDSSKLSNDYPSLEHISISIIKLFERMKINLTL